MTRLATLLSGWPVSPGLLSPLDVGGLTRDSRRVRPGDAFVALPGAQAHGLEFAAEALAAGAVVVLHDAADAPPTELADRCVAIEGLGARTVDLVRRFHGDALAGLDLFAVTGTNGKSSVAWLMAQALDGAMIGTLGIGRPGAMVESSHTTPDLFATWAALAELARQGVRHVALEASSHALDQGRLAGLTFTATAFTNLGHDHLDYHGSREAYGAAKARLFRDHASRRQWINLDDAFGRALASNLRGNDGLRTYALDPSRGADVTAEIRRADLDGLALTLHLPDGRVEAETPLIGRVNVLNLMIVAGELAERGVDREAIAAKLAALVPVPGRMNRVDGAERRVVIDYAHTPDALENALAALRPLTRGQLICVFGCGGNRDRAKRPEMGRIAEGLADRVILTDDNPRHEDGLSIVREIQAGMQRPDRSRVMRDRAEAIRLAIREAGPDDVVLVAGKGHEREQIVGDTARPFSDFDAVRAALEAAA
ncbi:UDP-N-acetylmuramoyl-L-alanyl-D-glutamate--2,6-diaminopimelate ligase [Wenzhouxiangella sp. XN79A]|uniref:UDP-N-acetylmuramoyl-L-alanyl-D-glutamate--2, 6-diaminopimelate ligase n=1 Tax=Wenzhouxiangella sp. XN79A TaxID=2724193 RepID=UPI00144AFA13|nr:UDP-N-acetylmuramoyl-L-alanyl-D-glutamate--2,6-diaminopimelate ligase [Wenzhouxiangella sp. XN79A]NKI34332.1 UDP-N-acetylmuramoyl-L-alanyl-D-glutamate--2,6-diaminopimelate ligase [Wenzhouxiangella sp. XN79A]